MQSSTMSSKCENYCCANCSQPSYKEIEAIAKFLKSEAKIKPKIGIICGSGLDSITTLIDNVISIRFKDIPNFPLATAPGHEGYLHFGTVSLLPIVCMQGRSHYYEGYPLWKVVLPIRVMKILGVSILIISNSAGGINNNLNIGDIMIIKDHISFLSLAGVNPLQGPNEEKFGPRFLAVSDAYDSELLKLAKQAVKNLKLSYVREGVYACVGGPSFETVAEAKMLKMLGADAVGMSTIPEVIAARHCDIKCFAFSLICNLCPTNYDNKTKANHDEILAVGSTNQRHVLAFLEMFLELILENEQSRYTEK